MRPTPEQCHIREGALLYAAYCIAETVDSEHGWFKWRNATPRTHAGRLQRLAARDLGNKILATVDWAAIQG